jgi:hypothetical protein
MVNNYFKILGFYIKKKLTRILQFFNFSAGKILRVNTPNPSLYGRLKIQLENEGQNFEQK